MKTEIKQCANCKSDFQIEPEDFEFYEKIKVPSPTWCPECRMWRKMLFRNENSLFKRNCVSCGKEIITIYHPDATVVVYCNDCWWSDRWDAARYGRPYNFNKTFFEQFAELLKTVPRMALEGYQNENSPYTNYTWFSKNIYLCSSAIHSQNIAYSSGVTRCEDSFDCLYIYNSNHLYECIDCHNCATSTHLTDCRDCLDSAFLYDCRGCQHCFMSANLRNKTYVFRNRELSKKDYETAIMQTSLSNQTSFAALVNEYEQVKAKALHRFASIFRGVNSTGHNLANVKNARNCFTGENLDNVAYGIRVIVAKDSMDLYGVGDGGAELLYEGINVGYKDSLIRFSTNTYENIRDVTYCDYCRNSQNLFGCAGLRKKQFHILNKAYSKEEYESLIPKIIDQMNRKSFIDQSGREYFFGEFYPPELSPFAYNESIANEFYPRTETEARAIGAEWRPRSQREYRISVNPENLPDAITEVDDSITKEIIGCANNSLNREYCAGAFRITESELRFYRNRHLPLPHLCPACRHNRRARYRNPLNTHLYSRNCSNCSASIKTPYSPERPEIVYCEKCYQNEVA